MLCFSSANAAELRVAVSTNFHPTARQLATLFESASNHKVQFSSASSGVLYQQILHGAPYDVFLSADTQFANLLIEKGLASYSFTYARGQLVLAANSEKDLPAGMNKMVLTEMLASLAARSIAIAKPQTAPYGLAAKQLYQELGIWPQTRKSRVEAGSIAQAALLLDTGHVRHSFVAKSLAINHFKWRDIPSNWYPPIIQKGVILNASQKSPSAKSFAEFLKSHPAIEIMTTNGYLPE